MLNEWILNKFLHEEATKSTYQLSIIIPNCYLRSGRASVTVTLP